MAEKIPDYTTLLERAVAAFPEDTTKDIRFEVPKGQADIQGNRTFVPNFSEIASYLHREPGHLLKFLLKECGTAGNLDAHRAVFMGKITPMKLNHRVDKYVAEFVTCPECGKPDTKILKEDRISFLRCMACGARHSIRNL